MPKRIVRGTDPRVRAHMAAHHGLITPERARDLGVSTTYIRAMVRDGLWIVLRRGVYVDAEVWDALDPWRGRPLLQARAVSMSLRRGCVLSHDSAAHALVLDVLVEPGSTPHVHVTHPGDAHAWKANGVGHHLARFTADDVLVVDDLHVLNHARTVVDMAREHGVRSGLVTADSALRQGLVTKDDLWAVADRMASWPHITDVRAVIEHGDHRSQSALEVLGREFVLELGIGTPDLQWPVRRPDGRVAWCDIRVNRHIFECSGKIKVLRPDDGGVADRPAADVLWDERKRERLVTAEGLGMTNLYYEDFFGAARRAALRRARADYDHTVQRYGVQLPEHLERNAREIRARSLRPGAS